MNAPREFAARFFNIRSWVSASGGGHFDAWERPEDYGAGRFLVFSVLAGDPFPTGSKYRTQVGGGVTGGGRPGALGGALGCEAAEDRDRAVVAALNASKYRCRSQPFGEEVEHGAVMPDAVRALA